MNERMTQGTHAPPQRTSRGLGRQTQSPGRPGLAWAGQRAFRAGKEKVQGEQSPWSQQGLVKMQHAESQKSMLILKHCCLEPPPCLIPGSASVLSIFLFIK